MLLKANTIFALLRWGNMCRHRGNIELTVAISMLLETVVQEPQGWMIVDEATLIGGLVLMKGHMTA